jgi:hypothetical protein
MMLCDRELQRIYRQYNRRWFDDQLPDDVDCLFSPVDDCYGLVQQAGGGWLLQINPKYSMEGRLWRLTLLHEMVHLHLNPYLRHGLRFQEEMQRLAASGAFRRLW